MYGGEGEMNKQNRPGRCNLYFIRVSIYFKLDPVRHGKIRTRPTSDTALVRVSSFPELLTKLHSGFSRCLEELSDFLGMGRNLQGYLSSP
ncbi:hypothetical protein TNIN_17301 [Trichonephila inaurata madagascariensis]|uniref:Uncharacterized protein n=1 Tax=Trichonephila inaurata madagascariensis TaxID=2747483 RepID=A0A8X6INY8_9ARAC|nr:hypothetical protein TNIN_17301 [Trichonephila inaurata madagascariensis]